MRQVTTAEFEEAIQDCATPIILDVFAVWCGPCQLMAPQLELVAEKLGDKVRARARVSVRVGVRVWGRVRVRVRIRVGLRVRPKVLINPNPTLTLS